MGPFDIFSSFHHSSSSSILNRELPYFLPLQEDLGSLPQSQNLSVISPKIPGRNQALVTKSVGSYWYVFVSRLQLTDQGYTCLYADPLT